MIAHACVDGRVYVCVHMRTYVCMYVCSHLQAVKELAGEEAIHRLSQRVRLAAQLGHSYGQGVTPGVEDQVMDLDKGSPRGWRIRSRMWS